MIVDALVQEAVEVLKLTGDLSKAQGCLIAGMNRYNFVYWEQIVTVNKFKEASANIARLVRNTDTLRRFPKFWRD